MRPVRLPLFAIALTACGAPDPDAPLLIENVAVVDVARGVTDSGRSVLIRGRMIEAVDGRHTADGARRVDGTGLFLMPGLWDMHVHVEEADLPLLIAWGVTGARDMGAAIAPRRAWQQRIATGALTGPRLVVTGPMLAGPPAEADDDRWLVRSAAEGVRAVDSLAALGAAFVKVHDGLSRQALQGILRAARARRLTVTGHMPSDTGAVGLVRAGLRVIEHLEFVPDRCMVLFRPVRAGDLNREPAPLECLPDEMDTLFMNLRQAGAWLDPTISSFRIWVTPTHYRVIYEGFRDIVPSMQRSRIPLLAGTDLGDDRIIAGESLHDELSLLVEAGFTPAEALRAATINPARVLGLEDSLGAVAPGRIADLVLLEADPLREIRASRRIVAVIREGRLLDRDALDALMRPR